MRDHHLTPTQWRVLVELALSGDSNRQLARTLGMAPGTVGTHISAIMLKTGKHTRAELVAYAWHAGYVWANSVTHVVFPPARPEVLSTKADAE